MRRIGEPRIGGSGGSRGGLAGAVVLTALLVPWGPAAAVPPGAEGAAAVVDTVPAAQDPLERAALAFARAWAEGAGAGKGPLMVDEGVRLQLEGASHRRLSSRQASAALRDFLRHYEEGEVTVVRAAPVAGSADRGFAEIRWTARVRGTAHRVNRTIFVGFVRVEPDRWMADEVRVLP